MVKRGPKSIPNPREICHEPQNGFQEITSGGELFQGFWNIETVGQADLGGPPLKLTVQCPSSTIRSFAGVFLDENGNSINTSLSVSQ